MAVVAETIEVVVVRNSIDGGSRLIPPRCNFQKKMDARFSRTLAMSLAETLESM